MKIAGLILVIAVLFSFQKSAQPTVHNKCFGTGNDRICI